MKNNRQVGEDNWLILLVILLIAKILNLTAFKTKLRGTIRIIDEKCAPKTSYAF